MMVGITGHQQLPPEAVPHIEHALSALFSTFDTPVTGVTSLAAGADQLFATFLLARGAALHIVIPCDDYERAFEHEAEVSRFHALLARATHIERLPYPAPSEDAFFAAGRRVVDLSDRLIAIWDGQPARGKGGTADVVAYASRKGIPVDVLWPEGQTR